MAARTTSAARDRGDTTRDRLLSAAIDVFGRQGFDATTTRALAAAAKVNLQAIAYHFDGKEGLYLAAAEHIAARIADHVADQRKQIEERLDAAETDRETLSPDDARDFLATILERMAVLVTSAESETWARFLIREQMEPTEAFKRIYAEVMGPLLQSLARLVGVLLGEDPDSKHVRLRTFSLVGSLLGFRTAHAAALAHLGWKRYGPSQVKAVRALAVELANTIVRKDATR